MKRIPVLTALTTLLTLWTITVLAAVPQLINFQGILRDGSGNPVANGPYSVQFTIYDAPSAGTNLWQETQSVTTTSGLFTVLLGIGPTPLDYSIFNDSTRWLGVKVGADPEMTPRQRLSSVGYSHNSAEWTSAGQNLFRLNGTVGIGITPSPFSNAKLEVAKSGGDPSPYYGAYVQANNNTGDAYGGRFSGSSTGGTAYGVYGGGANYGVYGNSSSGYGVYGVGDPGVYGTGTNYGGFFSSTSNIGVWGSGSQIGVYGVNGTYGVYGESYVNGGAAVFGNIGGNFGTWGGYFQGDVLVERNLVVNGFIFKNGGGFKIDHPTDPANKYLYHSFVESPDMMNIYNGNITLDGKGEATIQLPDWFGAVNKDFRYQLTAIGAPGPNLYIAEEISKNQFKIAGGTAGMKVSWQVTGIRQDAYANAHRIPVEEVKTVKERGKYLHPEEHGAPATLGMHYEETQKMAAERKQMEEQQAKMEAERKLHEEERAKMEQERVIQEQKIKKNQPNK